MKFLNQIQNTTEASFMMNILVKLFAKKHKEWDDFLNCNVIIGKFFGKEYFIDYEKEDIND